jgi:hypothetical protein
MLDYISRPMTISVIRPRSELSGTSVPLGFITKKTFEVAINDGVSITDEELQEIESLAASYKAAAASVLQATALNFPETVTQVMDYYEGQAAELEKHLIRSAVQGAARRLRRSPSPPERRQLPAPRMPTADIFAGMLYDVLVEDGRFEVNGNPRIGKKTYLTGQWDLTEIARSLLATLEETK